MILTDFRDYLKELFIDYEVTQEETKKVLIAINVLESMIEKLSKDLESQDRFLSNIKSCIQDREAQIGEVSIYFDNCMKKADKELKDD